MMYLLQILRITPPQPDKQTDRHGRRKEYNRREAVSVMTNEQENTVFLCTVHARIGIYEILLRNGY